MASREAEYLSDQLDEKEKLVRNLKSDLMKAEDAIKSLSKKLERLTKFVESLTEHHNGDCYCYPAWSNDRMTPQDLEKCDCYNAEARKLLQSIARS